MRARFVAFALVTGLLTDAAHAALNAVTTVLHFESSGQNVPTTGNSTASGYFQITNQTWNSTIAPNTGLPAVGPGTANPNGVVSLSAAQQQQGFDYLVQTRGLQDYTCSNCDPALTNYVNANGGAGNFTLNGDPPPGIPDQTPPELAAAIANSNISSSGSPDASFLTAGATAQPAAGIAGTAAAGAAQPVGGGGGGIRPFTWVWNHYQDVVAQPINNETVVVLQDAEGALGALLFFVFAFLGARMAASLATIDDLWRKFFKILFVVALIGPGGLYQQDFVGLVTSLPTSLIQGLGLGGVGNGPAASFDNIASTFNATLHHAWQMVPWGVEMFLDGAIALIAFLVFYVVLIAAFVVWFIAQIIPQILLIIGPFLVLVWLFDYFQGVLIKYVATLGLMALVAVVANIVTQLVLQIMGAAFGAVSQTGGGTAMVTSLFLATVAIVILGAVIIKLPPTLEHLAGAVGVPSPRQALNAIRNGAANTATVMAGGATGGPATAAALKTVASRSLSGRVPAGRSLSRGI